MNDADSRGESQFKSAFCNLQSVPLVLYPSPDYGIDVHVKFGMLSQPLQLFVEHFQGFQRNVIWYHVIYGDLEMIESSLIEPFDALRHQQISVGNQAANHSVGTDAANDVIQLRMQQWLATTDHDKRCA